MPYVRKTWQCGDVVTDEALNNIEDGIEEALQGGGGGVLVVHIEELPCPNNPEKTLLQLDKTWQEIHDAFLNGAVVIPATNSFGDLYQEGIQAIGETGGFYSVMTYDSGVFGTDSADGYPCDDEGCDK